MKDSDGDGRTNGEELGDPKCRWVQGQLTDQSKPISHPGKTFNSPAMNDYVTWLYESSEYSCLLYKWPECYIVLQLDSRYTKVDMKSYHH